MQQMRLSKPPGIQANRDEQVGVEPATNRSQTEEPVVPTGLCSTCNNLPTCTLRRCDQHPVMFCEEFDGAARAAATVTMMERTPLAARDQRIYDSEQSSKHRGLCRTCEHREGCTFPKSEGGVWQCEEFV